MRLYGDQLIVVTGGAGFIGSHVVKHLNDLGYKNILIVDDLGKTEKWKNLVGKTFLNIISKHELFNWLDGKDQLIEAFIHLGACTSTVETDASYLIENNFHYSVRLAEYAIHHNKRFIYASSAATYGDGELGFHDNELNLETLKPLNAYGFSKQLFDLWLKNHGLLNRVVGLKYFNVFGPNEGHKGRMASAVYHMTPVAKKTGSVKLFQSSEPEKYSDGEQKRDFIYVKDVAKMTCAFLNNDATGIFNIGSGVAETWNNLATHVFNALGQKVQIEYIPMPQDLIGKYQNYSKADMTKTKQALGSEAVTTPFGIAIEDYVKNYLLKGA